MYCTNCGRQIDDRAAICVYCGVPTDNYVAPNGASKQPSAEKVNGFGIAGFVLSIVSIWFGIFFCITPLIGLIFSIIGMVNKPKCNKCNGLAVAGLVINIVFFSIWFMYWFVAFLAIL